MKSGINKKIKNRWGVPAIQKIHLKLFSMLPVMVIYDHEALLSLTKNLKWRLPNILNYVNMAL